MTPGRLRLLSLIALVVPVALTAVATTASQGFGALALATAAAGGALLLAGPAFRVILGALIAALGVCTILVALFTAADPGEEGLLTLAIVAGALQIAIGISLAATARLWPASKDRRYSRTRVGPREDGGEGDPIGDWDALSSGDDPTDPAR